jgi:hypothetical protein
MWAWAIHFMNVQCFQFQREDTSTDNRGKNKPSRIGKYNIKAAYAAYKKEWGADARPLRQVTKNKTKLRKRMRLKRYNVLRKTKVKDQNIINRARKRSKANLNIKTSLVTQINEHAATTAMFEVVANGPGGLAKYHRSRMAATKINDKLDQSISSDTESIASETQNQRRRSWKHGTIKGIRSRHDSVPKRPPAHSANKQHNSVSRMIRNRIDNNPAKYWDALAEEGIIGLSLNGEHGINCYNILLFVCIHCLCIGVFVQLLLEDCLFE